MVIGLAGSKGSGKDYFYKVAKRAFPLLDIRRVAYADPICREVSKTFGLETEEEYDLFKRTDLHFRVGWDRVVSGREAVRSYGMMMRGYDKDQFVRYVNKEIKQAPDAIWCITDLRFENELASIKLRGHKNGKVVKIKRIGFDYDGHVTETELPDEVCDIIIENYGTLGEYEHSIVETFTMLRGVTA